MDPLREKSYQFSLKIMDLLEEFPKNYLFQTLSQQLLRSASSIGANIAEAQAGTSRRDFVNYYHIALKSSNETSYWLQLIRMRLSEKKKIEELLRDLSEIAKMLTASLLTLKGKRNY